MAPTTMGELREYLRGVQGLRVTPAAREGMRTILAPPMPLAFRPLWIIPATASVAILPRFARRLYGLPWFGPATIPVRVNVYALTRAMNILFPRLRSCATRGPGRSLIGSIPTSRPRSGSLGTKRSADG